MKINPIIAKKKKDVEDITINMKENTKDRKKDFINTSGVKEIVIILCVVFTFMAGYFLFQQFVLKPSLNNTVISEKYEKSNEIKANVGKLLDLYDLNELSVVSINNIDNLKQENPDFYSRAKNGDYVLLSTKRAILYDKDKNLILNIAPVAKDSVLNTTSTITPKL